VLVVVAAPEVACRVETLGHQMLVNVFRGVSLPTKSLGDLLVGTTRVILIRVEQICTRNRSKKTREASERETGCLDARLGPQLAEIASLQMRGHDLAG
jgi:hypothetical protein